jgi:hypothetical protein
MGPFGYKYSVTWWVYTWSIVVSIPSQYTCVVYIQYRPRRGPGGAGGAWLVPCCLAYVRGIST